VDGDLATDRIRVYYFVVATGVTQVSIGEPNAIPPSTPTQFNLFRIYFEGGSINKGTHSDKSAPHIHRRNSLVEEHPQVEPLGP
jgi:hypothetical protein